MRYQVRGNTDRCLGVGSTSVGTQLELYDCDDNNDLRLWALNENEQLVLKANSNRCAERLGSGSTVEIQQCSTGDSSQRVRYDTNNDYELRFTSFGQCMEYSSEDFGENIITLSCDGASNQEWEQVEANGGESDGYELISEEPAIVVLVSMVPAPGRRWKSSSATAATTTAFGVWTAIIGSVWLPTQTDVPAGAEAQAAAVISSLLRLARIAIATRIGNTIPTKIMNFRVEAAQRSASNTILPASEHLSLLERAMVGRTRSLTSAFTRRSIHEETGIAAWV